MIKSLTVANAHLNINAKLLCPFEGPYIVSQQFGDCYELKYPQIDKVRGKFNVCMIYPYLK